MAFIVVVIAIITIGNAETDTDTAAPMAWASLGTFVFWAGLAIALWRWPVEYRRPK